jgi:hypothetical protein
MALDWLAELAVACLGLPAFQESLACLALGQYQGSWECFQALEFLEGSLPYCA